MIQTIQEVIKKLEENNIDYFLTGGTSLFLRNLLDKTKDVDISIKEEDFKKAKTLFKNETLLTANKAKITFYKNNYQVELLLSSEKKDHIAEKVFREKKFETIKFNNKKINLIPLKELLLMYRFIYLRDGREKHLERIKFLEKINKS